MFNPANATSPETKNDAKRTQANANKTVDAARDTVVDLQDDFRSVANRTGRKVRDFIDHAADEVHHARDSVTTQIKAKPVESSLVALAIGFVIGALARR
jgi:hypothetical protein